MELSYAEARAFCIAHYAKRGMTVDYWSRSIPASPDEVFRIYGEIQKELEDSKRVGKRPLPPLGGLQVYETYILEEAEEPAGSQ